MTATAPATEAPPASDALVVVSPTTVIARLQVLAGDIAQAQEEAVGKKFNYADKKQNRECRSYLAKLRTYNGDIDKAHKEAKADNLKQGRQIDAVKNTLKDKVAALIQPHKDALDDIDRKEAERVAKHQKVIGKIKDAARVPFGFTSGQIMEIHLAIADLDLTGMEEFEVEAKAAWADTHQVLKAAWQQALQAEEKEAELARLREEARLQAERDAETKRIKDEQEAAAEVARKAQEAADATALLVIKEAEQKSAQKLAETEAALAAANRRALDAEAVANALQGEASLTIGSTAPPTIDISDQAVAGVRAVAQGLARMEGRREGARTSLGRSWPARVDTPDMPCAEVTRCNDLAAELSSALTGKTRVQVVKALLDGTFHPAVCIDWSKA